jgi:hypothetical protein
MSDTHATGTRTWRGDERGVALPMAMLALLVLSIQLVGFSFLSTTEPTIAGNQLMAAQARSLAEAGIERAMWALNNPDAPQGIPGSAPLPASWTAPAPYDGSQLVSVASAGARIGGFRVTVTRGASSAELVISSVGWVPDDSARSVKAHRTMTVTVFNPRFLFKDPPAAVSVRGALQAGGNALIDSRGDTSCGAKSGTVTTGALSMDDDAPAIYGADGNDTRNQRHDAAQGAVPASAFDAVENVDTRSLDAYAWTTADISALRTYARAKGTYRQGSVSFSAADPIPNGVVFVDTVSGRTIAADGDVPGTSLSDLARVDIRADAPADPDGVFKGLLFVNGTLSVDGNFTMHGFVHAESAIRYRAVGPGGVRGAMVSRNIGGQSPTRIDSDSPGTAVVAYDCQHVKSGGGSLADRWNPEPGTYRETCDSCG